MMGRTVKTPEKEEEFLTHLAETGGNVTESARLSGIHRSMVYAWRKEDEGFASRFAEAIEQGTDALEDEVIRRGMMGVDEPVFYLGKQVATIRKYSDTLLMYKLNGQRPEKFRYQRPEKAPPAAGEEGGVTEYRLPDNGR